MGDQSSSTNKRNASFSMALGILRLPGDVHAVRATSHPQGYNYKHDDFYCV